MIPWATGRRRITMTKIRTRLRPEFEIRTHKNRTQVVVVVIIKKQQLLLLARVRRNLCMPVSTENRWYIQRRLGDNQRDIANRYLSTLSPADRQPILDELEGRFQAEQKGMKPVYDEISFLFRLCELMKSGEFRAQSRHQGAGCPARAGDPASTGSTPRHSQRNRRRPRSNARSAWRWQRYGWMKCGRRWECQQIRSHYQKLKRS